MLAGPNGVEALREFGQISTGAEGSGTAAEDHAARVLLRSQSLPLLLLASLPLRAIIEQERQRTTKGENDQALEDVRVDVVAVVAVAAVEVVLVVIWFVVVPAGKFGFEEGAEPFGE